MSFMYRVKSCYFLMSFMYRVKSCYFLMSFMYRVKSCYFLMSFLYRVKSHQLPCITMPLVQNAICEAASGWLTCLPSVITTYLRYSFVWRRRIFQGGECLNLDLQGQDSLQSGRLVPPFKKNNIASVDPEYRSSWYVRKASNRLPDIKALQSRRPHSQNFVLLLWLRLVHGFQ